MRRNRALPESLVGLWGGEHAFSTGPNGMLVIDGRTSSWVAHLAGFVVPVERHQSSVSFRLPAHQGRFEGRISPDGRSIRGYWIQPTTVVDGFPFFSPVELVPSGRGAWLGTVQPLLDQLTLYLVVRSNSDGSVTAFIRNPESNFGAHRFFRVEVAGTSVRLINTRKEGDEIRGTYDPTTDRLSLTIQKNILGLDEDPLRPYKKTIDRWVRPDAVRGQQTSVSSSIARRDL